MNRVLFVGLLAVALATVPPPPSSAAESRTTRSAGQAPAADPGEGWPETREGTMARRWVAAFDSGEEAMRRFYRDELAESARKERSLGARIERYREWREKFGSLALGSVVKQAPGELTVKLIDADASPHTFVVRVQQEPPYRLLLVGLQQFRGHAGFGGFHH